MRSFEELKFVITRTIDILYEKECSLLEDPDIPVENKEHFWLYKILYNKKGKPQTVVIEVELFNESLLTAEKEFAEKYEEPLLTVAAMRKTLYMLKIAHVGSRTLVANDGKKSRKVMVFDIDILDFIMDTSLLQEDIEKDAMKRRELEGK